MVVRLVVLVGVFVPLLGCGSGNKETSVVTLVVTQVREITVLVTPTQSSGSATQGGNSRILPTPSG